MGYRVNRALGYQPWGVTNPWVYADLSQPQRLRGGVSPIVFQTHGYFPRTAHLGQAAEVSEEVARAKRMERIAIAGLALSAASFALFASMQLRKGLRNNGRRRRRRR